jgi:ACS family D-galactonate transporter-like MFS transporter
VIKASKSGSASTASGMVLLVLLVASIFINYIDRSNLSIAAPLIQKQMHFTDGQMGLLFSAFFWTYSSLQLVGISGWLSDRFSVGWVLAASFLVWSGATLATGMLSGFVALFGMRLLLGAGESLAYPCYCRILANEVPQHQRGRANAFLDAASKLGPGVGTFIGGLMMVRFGWRIFFVLLGLASLVWLVPWLRCMPHRPGVASATIIPFSFLREMLSKRTAIGTLCGHFLANYFWFFLLIWLPSYLVNERGFSITRMATIGSLAYCSVAVATICAGWLSDWFITKGVPVTNVRKTFVVLGLLGSSAVLPVAFLHEQRQSLAFLFVSCMAFGTYTSNHWAITQTVAGPIMAGRWTSVQNGIGNYSGIFASWLTGLIVQHTGSFQLAFAVAAAVVVLSAIMWGWVVGPVCEVAWTEQIRRGEKNAVAKA